MRRRDNKIVNKIHAKVFLPCHFHTMSTLFLLILYFFALVLSDSSHLSYVSIDKEDFSVHPLASTSLDHYPPVTVEVTPSNDTLINVYFTSTPQHLAILIHLTNTPHPLNTDYSSILITTNPPGNPPVYSGTITFMSTAENSTVGFRIPPSPNGAVITIDVPKGPKEVQTKNHPNGKTKIRLIHLTTVTSGPSMATDNSTMATTVTKSIDDVTSDSGVPFTSVSWTDTDDGIEARTVPTARLHTTSTTMPFAVPTNESSDTLNVTFSEDFGETTSYTADDTEITWPFLTTTESSLTTSSSTVTTEIYPLQSATELQNDDMTETTVENPPSTPNNVTENATTRSILDILHTTAGNYSSELTTTSSPSSVTFSEDVNVRLTTSHFHSQSSTNSEKQSTFTPVIRSTESRTSSSTAGTSTTLRWPRETSTQRISSTTPSYEDTTPAAVRTVILNSTCPTIYNIYVQVNLTASFNQTPLNSDRSNVNSDPTTTQLTANNDTVDVINISRDDELSSPRKVPNITFTTKIPSVLLTTKGAIVPSTASTSPPLTVSTVDFSTSTSTTTKATTSSSSSTSTEVNLTVNFTEKSTETSTSSYLVTVRSTSYAPVAPTSYWVISIIVAKSKQIDSAFIAEITENLSKVYEEAYKRQQQQMLGLLNRTKRADNQILQVQMINVTRLNEFAPDEIQLLYYLTFNNTYIPVDTSLNAMETLTEQEAALLFGHVVVVKARPYLQVATSQSYVIEKKPEVLPIILGTLAGSVLIVVIVIIFVKLKCLKRKNQAIEESSSVTSFGHRNRLHAFDVDEDGDEVVSNIGRVEGGANNPKLSGPNILPNPSQVMTSPPPLPQKPKRKRRPLPSLPLGEYSNVASVAAESPTPHSQVLETHWKQNLESHRRGEQIAGGILEYLQAPISKVPASSQKDSTTVDMNNDENIIEAIDLKTIATQTEMKQQVNRQTWISEDQSEVDAISSEIHWHAVRQRMQEMIDNAVTALKNVSPSPKFNTSRLQSESNEVEPPSSTQSNLKDGNDIPEVDHQPNNSRSETRTRTNHIVVSPSSTFDKNMADEDFDQNMYRKPAKDSETEYLIKAIKEELQKFKHNFNNLPT